MTEFTSEEERALTPKEDDGDGVLDMSSEFLAVTELADASVSGNRVVACAALSKEEDEKVPGN